VQPADSELVNTVLLGIDSGLENTVQLVIDGGLVNAQLDMDYGLHG
jgi:hypothetical protein